MVERTTGISNEITGKVVNVIEIPETNYGKQYHLEIAPVTGPVGKTGCFHEFLRMSKQSVEDKVAEGSVMDLYLQALEEVLLASKGAPTVKAALEMMKNKTFVFKKKKLGRNFKEFEASEHWVPVKLVL